MHSIIDGAHGNGAAAVKLYSERILLNPSMFYAIDGRIRETGIPRPSAEDRGRCRSVGALHVEERARNETHKEESPRTVRRIQAADHVARTTFRLVSVDICNGYKL
jgi:hypothetical protein